MLLDSHGDNIPNSQYALTYHNLGLSVVAKMAGGKRPAGNWKQYQQRLPTAGKICQADWSNGCCLICGKVSGGLEVIDFDQHGEAFADWFAAVETLNPELAARLVIQRTQSDGRHVLYRCPEGIEGNQLLAKNAAGVLIETRGEGGLIVACPSPGYWPVDAKGNRIGDALAEPPTLTADERELLLNCARMFDEQPATPEPSRPRMERGSGERTPGDDYNERGDVRGLLASHGWRFQFTTSDGEAWCRPGKASGVSGKLFTDSGLFYVYSSNAMPLEANRSYDPFGLYAQFEHAGDYAVAAGELRRQGYGGEPTPVDLSGIDRQARAMFGDGASLTDGQPAKRIERLWTLGELEDEFPELQESLIDGLLRRGEVATIVAPPKACKSWLVQQLVFALAIGGQWLQFSTRRCRVLLIDCELQPQTLTFRLRKARRQLGLNADDLGDRLRMFPARDWQGDVQGLVGQLDGWSADGWRPDAIIVDPQYALLPRDFDENSNGHMKQFYGHLKALTKHGAAVVTVHHMSKGNQTGRSVTDIGAGAGAQSRAADCWLTLQQHKDPDILVFGSAIRSFKPIEPFCVRRVWTGDGVMFTIDPAADPTDLPRGSSKERKPKPDPAEKGEQQPKLTVDDLPELLEGLDPMKRDRLIGEIIKLADGYFAKLTKAQAGYLIDDAIKAGKLHDHQTAKGANVAKLWSVQPRPISPPATQSEETTSSLPAP